MQRRATDRLSVTVWALSCFILLMVWMMYRARRRRDYHLISLDQALAHMKTGDLILFSNRHISPGGLVTTAKRVAHLAATYAYRAVDSCEWGHVGVVYAPHDGQTGGPFLIHAELTSGQPDVYSGEFVTGVQVTNLREKLERYNGYCVWRPINRPMDENKVREFLQLTYPLGYRIPGDVWMRFLDRLIGARFRRRAPSDVESYRSSGGVFCTEWVGALFEFCGVFDKARAPYKTYYLPSDFTYKGCLKFLTPEYSFNNDGWEVGAACPHEPPA